MIDQHSLLAAAGAGMHLETKISIYQWANEAGARVIRRMQGTIFQSCCAAWLMTYAPAKGSLIRMAGFGESNRRLQI